MYTYGPVPSRRLGRSLGVSPIPPKTCSYTCVYCQLGRTDHLQAHRESFFPKEEVLAEIVDRATQTRPDYVTFVGDGEPTLCRDLGWLIEHTKDIVGLPVAVITNGSLLWRDDVQNDLMRADVVIPTLDAGNETTFRRINRPHPGITFDVMLEGQIAFKRSCSGRLWVEVMLVAGVNDDPDELLSIRQAIERIKPDSVFVLTPIRPPAESWVRIPTPGKIIEAQQILGGATAIVERETGDFGLEAFASATQAILEIGSRHPLRVSQAREIESHFAEPGTIHHMLQSQLLMEVEYGGEKYLLPARFVRGR